MAGYSGCGGVGKNESHAVSGVVAALPVVSARLIALTGRHAKWLYFDSRQAMVASACVTHSSAASRAWSTRLRLATIVKGRRLRGQKLNGASL